MRAGNATIGTGLGLFASIGDSESKKRAVSGAESNLESAKASSPAHATVYFVSVGLWRKRRRILSIIADSHLEMVTTGIKISCTSMAMAMTNGLTNMWMPIYCGFMGMTMGHICESTVLLWQYYGCESRSQTCYFLFCRNTSKSRCSFLCNL